MPSEPDSAHSPPSRWKGKLSPPSAGQRQCPKIGQLKAFSDSCGLSVILPIRRDDGFDLFEATKFGRGRKLSGTDQLCDRRLWNMFDVALPPIQQFDLFGIDIESQHVHARACESKRQRQPYIPKTDNSYFHSLTTRLRKATRLLRVSRFGRKEKQPRIQIKQDSRL